MGAFSAKGQPDASGKSALRRNARAVDQAVAQVSERALR